MSEATFEYFANATEAAVGCATSAATVAGYGYKVLGSAFMGACAYKVVAGKVMTGHAFGWAMSTFVKAAISTAAWRFYAHPTVAMGICVGAALAYSPENTFELLKNTTYTGIEAAKFAYANTAGIV